MVPPKKTNTYFEKKVKPSSASLRKSWTCLFCGKIFPYKTFLDVHMNSHTRERPFECSQSQCDAAFSNPSGLHYHIDKVHLGNKHVCNVCNKSFSGPHNLYLHTKTRCSRVQARDSKKIRKPFPGCIQAMRGRKRENQNIPSHTAVFSKARKHHKTVNKTTYVCTFCDKRFLSKGGLEFHMNSHTKERPNQCSKCNVDYTNPSALDVHYKAVHLGIKFSCNMCQKLFSCRANFIAHKIKTHSHSKKSPKTIVYRNRPYKNVEKEKINKRILAPRTCVFCNKTFSTRNKFVKHFNLEKNSSECCACDKKFATLQDLYAHRNTVHLGGKYSCGICNKSYSSKSNLLYHQRANLHFESKVAHISSLKMTSTKTNYDEKNEEEEEERKKKEHSEKIAPPATVDNMRKSVPQENIHHEERVPVPEENFLSQCTVQETKNCQEKEHYENKLLDTKATNSVFTSPQLLVVRREIALPATPSSSPSAPYSCHFCQHRFVRKKYLKIHLASTHRMSLFLARTKGIIILP